VAINNKESVAANYPLPYMPIKVLQLLQPKLIYCPAVLRDYNNPIMGYSILLVPGREVMAALKDDKGWNSLSYRVDTLDDCCPLPITLLHCLWPSSSL
jgi:hypothetical protein